MVEVQKELVTITPQGKIERTPLVQRPSLEQLKTAIGGGYIELIPFFNKLDGKPCIAFCDENGKLNHQEINVIATIAWMQAVGRSVDPDYLVGQIAIVVGPPEWLRDM